jgi:sensor domain CHASE-containing protein
MAPTKESAAVNAFPPVLTDDPVNDRVTGVVVTVLSVTRLFEPVSVIKKSLPLSARNLSGVS